MCYNTYSFRSGCRANPRHVTLLTPNPKKCWKLLVKALQAHKDVFGEVRSKVRKDGRGIIYRSNERTWLEDWISQRNCTGQKDRNDNLIFKKKFIQVRGNCPKCREHSKLSKADNEWRASQSTKSQLSPSYLTANIFQRTTGRHERNSARGDRARQDSIVQNSAEQVSEYDYMSLTESPVVQTPVNLDDGPQFHNEPYATPHRYPIPLIPSGCKQRTRSGCTPRRDLLPLELQQKVPVPQVAKSDQAPERVHHISTGLQQRFPFPQRPMSEQAPEVDYRPSMKSRQGSLCPQTVMSKQKSVVPPVLSPSNYSPEHKF